MKINKLSYDSKSKYLVLEDVSVMGATLLGTDPETGEAVEEGMEGACLSITDFSVDKNSIFNKKEFIDEITQAIFEKLDNHINNQRKEEGTLDKIFEEETTEVTEVEEKPTEEETPEVVENSDEPVEEQVEEFAEKEEAVEETAKEEESAPEEVEAVKNYSVEYSVKFNDEVKTFSSSLMEKLNALYELVNGTYGESDNTWYDVDAYDDEKIVVMHDNWNGRHYRQSYSVKKDVYSLKGDRVEVFCTYLTKDEQAQVDSMKSNYAVVSEKLAKYEEEPNKIKMLESEEYGAIANEAEFAELKKQENHFDLSIDELKNKADAMLLQYAKSGKLNFARVKNEEKKETKKDFFAFARIEKDNDFLDNLLNEK